MEQAVETGREEMREDDDEEVPRSETVEMYLDSESDDSETEWRVIGSWDWKLWPTIICSAVGS